MTDSLAAGGKPSKPKKEKKEKKEPKLAPTTEPMIIVNVNDRLGTKAAIPCLASDSIRVSLSLSLSDRPLRPLTSIDRRLQSHGRRTYRAGTA